MGKKAIARPGFYRQPNDWTCGPFALKHALVALGRSADALEIASTARTHWWSGTDEIRLARAAREFACDLVLERRRDEETARKLLTRHLRERTPVLLCVDQWAHWITVVGVDNGRFIVIDSLANPVLIVYTWAQLRARWRYYDKDYDRRDPPILYDLMAVVPRFLSTIPADFSVERIKFLRRPTNRHLAAHWTEYLEDLLSICKPPSIRIVEPLSMGEFLRRHQELIISRVVFWHGAVERDDVLRVLGDLRFVSETYGLVIPAASARRAVADLAILVTLWAAGTFGTEPMYGSRRKKRRKKKPARRGSQAQAARRNRKA